MRHLVVFVGILLSAPDCATAWAYDGLLLPSVNFSAIAVQQAGAMMDHETIHYADGKLRIDRGRGFSSTILDLTTQTQCLLMVNHTYIITPMDDELFRHYIARAPETSGSRKLGTQRIEGLETTKYAFGNDGGLNAAGTYWLTRSGVMVRRDYTDGVFGVDRHHLEFLTHISVEKQPSSLFEIPAGYKPTK